MRPTRNRPKTGYTDWCLLIAQTTKDAEIYYRALSYYSPEIFLGYSVKLISPHPRYTQGRRASKVVIINNGIPDEVVGDIKHSIRSMLAAAPYPHFEVYHEVTMGRYMKQVVI